MLPSNLNDTTDSGRRRFGMKRRAIASRTIEHRRGWQEQKGPQNRKAGTRPEM
jgi:hypothetical protein